MLLRGLLLIGLFAILNIQAETDVQESGEAVPLGNLDEHAENNLDMSDDDDDDDNDDEEVETKSASGTVLQNLLDLQDKNEDYDLDSYFEEYIEEDYVDDVTRRSACRRPCTRIYNPLCASINGVPTTIPSPCEYQNKVRCANWAKQQGQHYARIHYLYNGECRRHRPRRHRHHPTILEHVI